MRTKTIGRLSGIVGLALGFVVVNAATPLAVTPAAATHTKHPRFDANAAAAQTVAQAHLDAFFDFAMSGAATDALPRVKVRLNGQDRWVAPIERTSFGYVGALVDLENTNLSGEGVEFTKKNVRDWTFVGHDQRIFGSFHTRALLSDLPPATAARIAAVLSDPAIPTDW